MKKILTAPPHSIAPEALLLDEEASNTIDSWQTFEFFVKRKHREMVFCARTILYPNITYDILPYTVHTSCKGDFVWICNTISWSLASKNTCTMATFAAISFDVQGLSLNHVWFDMSRVLFVRSCSESYGPLCAIERSTELWTYSTIFNLKINSAKMSLLEQAIYSEEKKTS